MLLRLQVTNGEQKIKFLMQPWCTIAHVSCKRKKYLQWFFMFSFLFFLMQEEVESAKQTNKSQLISRWGMTVAPSDFTVNKHLSKCDLISFDGGLEKKNLNGRKSVCLEPQSPRKKEFCVYAS